MTGIAALAVLFTGIYAVTMAVANVAGMAFSDPGVRPRIARGLALACIAVGVALYVLTEGHRSSSPVLDFARYFVVFGVLSLPCWLAYWTLRKMLLASVTPSGPGLTRSEV